MDETFITLSIRNFLKKNGYFIIQCIPPGGQGGLNFKVNNRPVYPDIIASKESTMVICENKPSYSESDQTKLKKLSESENLISKSQEILNNYCRSKGILSSKILKIEFFLGFKKSANIPSEGINFFNVTKEGEVTILKS